MFQSIRTKQQPTLKNITSIDSTFNNNVSQSVSIQSTHQSNRLQNTEIENTQLQDLYDSDRFTTSPIKLNYFNITKCKEDSFCNLKGIVQTKEFQKTPQEKLKQIVEYVHNQKCQDDQLVKQSNYLGFSQRVQKQNIRQINQKTHKSFSYQKKQSAKLALGLSSTYLAPKNTNILNDYDEKIQKFRQNNYSNTVQIPFQFVQQSKQQLLTNVKWDNILNPDLKTQPYNQEQLIHNIDEKLKNENMDFYKLKQSILSMDLDQKNKEQQQQYKNRRYSSTQYNKQQK